MVVTLLLVLFSLSSLKMMNGLSDPKVKGTDLDEFGGYFFFI